jgi:mRNA interferase RelE/StbE
MYSVSIANAAEKALKRIDRAVKNRLTIAILELGTEPRPNGCLKVKSADGLWRIRVGDYRIGYEISDEAHTVKVVRIGHRSEFYD